MAFELTDEGLTIETADECRESVNDELRDVFTPSIDLSNGSLFGNLIAIVTKKITDVGLLLEAIYGAMDPDAATGTSLDQICALTGTVRLAASSSEVALTLTGDAGTVVAAGWQASIEDSGEVFETLAEATLVALTAWANTTAYVVGDRRKNSGNAYECTGAGTSAGSGGPTTEASSISDGTVTWTFLGEGVAAIDADAAAVNTGPVIGTARSIVTIETPVAGLDGVINLLDATPGTDIEDDEDLRVRREEHLSAPGTSPIDAVRSDLLEVESVTSVTIFQNTSDTTDGDGVPPHAAECLVQGGADQDIWDALLASVAFGIRTYGDEIGTAEDDSGNSHTMAFSRPEELLIYVDVAVTVNADTVPDDIEDQIKEAIVTWGDARKTGYDVVASAIAAQCWFDDSILDLTDIDIGTAPAPASGATVSVTNRQLAVFDTSRITVTVSYGTP